MKQSNSDTKVQFVQQEQINIQKWDEVVESHGGVNVYCYSWYLNAICDRWNALVLGDYEVIFPLPEVIKGGQSIIYQPFFSQLFLIAGKEVTHRQKAELINAIPDEYKLVHFSLPDRLPLNGAWGIEEVVYQELDLGKGYDELKRDYSENARRQIKKAVKASLVLEESDDFSKFIQLFKVQVGDRLGFTSENYGYLKKLMQAGVDVSKGKLLLVKKEEEIVAAGYFMIQNHRVLYLKGAATEEGKKTGAMFYLLDQMIQEYANRNVVFDFGGSKIESVAQFYKKFGGVDQVYYNYSKNTLPWLLKKAKELRDIIKK